MNKRGHPRKTGLDRLLVKLWSSDILCRSGMNCSQIERHFLVCKNPIDGKSMDLSHCWSKYASGKRLPRTPTREDGGIVMLAEKAFPKTKHWICNPLRMLDGNLETNTSTLVKLIAETSANISQLFSYEKQRGAKRIDLAISPNNWRHLSRMASLEAFGAMIAYCRYKREIDGSIDSVLTKDCRRWLHYAYHDYQCIRKYRDEMVDVMEKLVPELGSLGFLGNETPDYDPVTAWLFSEIFPGVC